MNSTSTVLSIGLFKLQFSIIAEMRDRENTWPTPQSFSMAMNLERKQAVYYLCQLRRLMRSLLAHGLLKVDVSLHHFLPYDFARNNLFKEAMFRFKPHCRFRVPKRRFNFNMIHQQNSQPSHYQRYLTLAPALQMQLHVL